MKAEPRSKQNGGGGGKGRKSVRTPHPLPHHFLYHPWFSFCVAESHTLRTTPKKLPAMQDTLKISLMS